MVIASELDEAGELLGGVGHADGEEYHRAGSGRGFAVFILIPAGLRVNAAKSTGLSSIQDYGQTAPGQGWLLLDGRLFRTEDDAKMILKWKEVIENLEDATDRCEDVADLFENILLEYA